MADKELNDIKQKYQVLNKQYNQLLEKNQNDLVTIKQKQKSMNVNVFQYQTLIAQLEGDKQDIRSKLNHQINILTLQLEKFKTTKSSNEINITSTQDNQEIQHIKKEKIALQSLINLKQNRIQQLQSGARKLIDENIQLTADNSQKKIQLQEAISKINEYEEVVKQLKSQLSKLEKKRNSSTQTQVQTQFKIYSHDQVLVIKGQTEKEAEKVKKLQTQLSHHRKETQQLKQSLKQQEEKMSVFKNRLRQTNDELKRYIDRDRKNTILLKKKDEQLGKIHDEVDKIRKNVKSERRKWDTEESICLKCKQWQQENKLLKQMVKSVQTMVRVREIEAEKYKQSLSPHPLNNSRQKEALKNKKSSDFFPPLKKQ